MLSARLPRSLRRLPLVAASLLALAPVARAALVAYDSFESYYPGPLHGSAGGTGWSGAWTGVSGISVSHESIPYSYTNQGATIVVGGGRSIKLAANATRALERACAPSTGLATRYVSFVFRIVDPTKAPGTEIPANTNLFSGWQAWDSAPSPSNDTIGIVGSDGKVGARVTDLSGNTSLAATRLNYNQTYFLVIKYSATTGSATYNTCTVWLNPALDAASEPTPTATKTVTTAGAGSNGFQGLIVRTHNLSASQYQLIDSVRIGTAWTDVVGATPPTTIQANANWAPYSLSSVTGGRALGIHAGSPLDQSARIDHTPAGARGRLLASGDHFAFASAPNTPVRFAGVNICTDALILTPTQITQLADDIKRSGYNSVRFHHFDHLVTTGSGNTFNLNTTRFNELDQLFRALKDRGIYISIDLFSFRKFSTSETTHISRGGISGELSGNNFKALIPIEPRARESWERYATLLLTTIPQGRNALPAGYPRTWRDDPALISICMVNEDNLYKHWAANSYIKGLYDTAFNAAKATEPGTTDAEKLSHFIFRKHRESEGTNKNFLLGLGVQALITGANYGGPAQGLAFQRSQIYDYVDEHTYYNHPVYQPGKVGTTPITSTQRESLVVSKADSPRDVMASRVFGKPFTVSEWNASRPNRYRAESAVLLPAIASHQGWSGLYNFQYGHKVNEVINGAYDNSFSITSDPINLVSARLTSLLFLRGDIQTSPNRIGWALRENEAFHGINNTGSEANRNALAKAVSAFYANVGFVTQIGMKIGAPGAVLGTSGISTVVTGTTPTPPSGTGIYQSTSGLAAALTGTPQNPASQRLFTGTLKTTIPPGGSMTVESSSDTGQMTLNSITGVATVVTARSELFALPPGAQSSGDQVVSIQNQDTPASVCVIAVDSQGHSLAQTSRILVAHLTDSLPTGATFADEDRRVLTSWGGAPHLVARGETTLTLRLASPPSGHSWKAYVLDHGGRRVVIPGTSTPRQIAMVAGASANGRTDYALNLATVTSDGTQLLYELFRSAN